MPVTVVTAASGQYETTLMSEMEKSEAPTLFQVNGPVGLANWKDYCYDLSGSQLYGELTSDSFALKDGDAVTSIAYVIETYGIIYNKELLTAAGYTQDDIKGFADLKKVADDIQARKAELGVDGAFTSAGMDGSSDWRFKTHLANLPIYYEYKADGIGSTDAIKGTYLDNYKQIWDLYITDSTCDPKLLASKTGNDAVAEFVGKKAVFYQNGTWAYNDVKDLGDDNLGMLPIYIGVEGEENQGLCTGSENFWCVNNTSSEEDIQATLDFLYWCVTSEAGTSAMADKMGFVIPFKKAKDSTNPLITIANQYVADWQDQCGLVLLHHAFRGVEEWRRLRFDRLRRRHRRLECRRHCLRGWLGQGVQAGQRLSTLIFFRNRLDKRGRANRFARPLLFREVYHAKGHQQILAGVRPAHPAGVHHRLHLALHLGRLPVLPAVHHRQQDHLRGHRRTTSASSQDSTFLHAFGFTAAFTVVSTVLINVCAFAIALVLTRGIRGTNLFRTVYFMPNLIGGILLGYIWQILLNGVLANLQKPLLALDARGGLRGSGHPDVLAADRLHDDHLRRGPAERPRRPHRGRQDRRCQRP